MASKLIKVERWDAGPKGFLPKANDQLSIIESAINRGPAGPTSTPVKRRKTIWIKLTGATSLNDNRWSYTYSVVVPDTAGTFTPIDPQPDYGLAYNSAEENNAATGTQGNGVNLDDLPDGSSLASADSGNPVVEAKMVVINGTRELRFHHVNGVNCSSGS